MERGEPLAVLHTNRQEKLSVASELVTGACKIGAEFSGVPKLILNVIQ